MSAQIQIVLIAVGCTSAVGLAGMGLIRLLRRASLRLSIQASGVVPVLAIAAGTLGTAKAMFLSQHDLGVVVMVCIIAGIVACAFSWLLGRQVASGSAALRQAARSLGDEADQFRPPGLPLAAEFAALSRELADTSAKLARSRARERALEQSRRQLVAWVSHDLRTPLAGLRAMAEALEDGLAADPPRYHKQMRVEAERLATMVDDLFELSRIHSGTLHLSTDEIALDDLVSDVLASTEALARERGVWLDGRAAGRPIVRADSRELSRALTNLLTNAIRHTPPGGRVHVEARREGGDALLAVADGCGGIPEADLAHVFELAWRGTDARSPAARQRRRPRPRHRARRRGSPPGQRAGREHRARLPLRDEAARLPLNGPPSGPRPAGRRRRELRDPLGERHRCPPAEFPPDTLAGRGHVPHVAEPVLAGDDGGGSSVSVSQRRRHVAHGARGAAAHVVGAQHAGPGRGVAARNGLKPGDGGARHVPDVDEVPALGPVLEDPRRAAGLQRGAEERRHPGVRRIAWHPGAVHVVIAQRHRAPPGGPGPGARQMLLRDLRVRVDVPRPDRCVLPHQLR